MTTGAKCVTVAGASTSKCRADISLASARPASRCCPTEQMHVMHAGPALARQICTQNKPHNKQHLLSNNEPAATYGSFLEPSNDTTSHIREQLHGQRDTGSDAECNQSGPCPLMVSALPCQSFIIPSGMPSSPTPPGPGTDATDKRPGREA